MLSVKDGSIAVLGAQQAEQVQHGQQAPGQHRQQAQAQAQQQQQVQAQQQALGSSQAAPLLPQGAPAREASGGELARVASMSSAVAMHMQRLQAEIRAAHVAQVGLVSGMPACQQLGVVGRLAKAARRFACFR